MRHALRRLQRETEIFRDLLLPIFQQALLRHAIERSVDLDGAEALGIVLKHVFRRDLFRIEASFPLLVAVAAGADEEIHD